MYIVQRFDTAYVQKYYAIVLHYPGRLLYKLHGWFLYKSMFSLCTIPMGPVNLLRETCTIN